MSEVDRQAAIEQEALLESFGITPMRFHFVALRQAMIDSSRWYMQINGEPVRFVRYGTIVVLEHMWTGKQATWPLDNFYAWTEQRFGQEIEKIIRGE